MEAATTLWYTTAKEFILACGWGRGKVHKLFIELKYIFIFPACQYLVNKTLVGISGTHFYNLVIQYYYTSNIPFLVCFGDKPGLFVLTVGILVH